MYYAIEASACRLRQHFRVPAHTPPATDTGNLRSNRTMAKFLNTSATNYFLEELIKNAKD
jgi:hypothetical protein